MTDQEKDLLTGCLRKEQVAWDGFVLHYSSHVSGEPWQGEEPDYELISLDLK
jgi:hypothetical protein